MAVVIRAVNLEDAVALTDLVRALGQFSSVTQESPAVTLERVERHLAVITSSERHTLLVAAEKGELIGYCSAHWIPMMLQLSGFVSELFVRPSRRGEGIGTRLLGHIENEARARGASRLHLENFRTKASYERGYYAKHGFSERPAAASFILDLRETTP